MVVDMPVHADSRIPLWVNTFSPTFYTSITDKENWTFSNYSDAELTAAKTLFSNMGSALDAYKATNRYNQYTSLIGSIYQYFLATRNFGAVPIPDESILHIDEIFSFGNFISNTLLRPVNYYNDIEETEPASGIFESQKLEDSIEYLTASAIPDENATITALISQLNPVSMNVILKGMFEEISQPAEQKGKRDVGEYIFNDLNYKKAFYQLNVTPYKLPSYITP